MINTIFYFPNEGEINFEGYYDRVGKNQDDGISNRTIVFEPDSGEIWKNGQKYSVGESVIKSWIQAYLDDNVQEVDLTGYATESWVLNYIQNQNYATKVWVENKGYLTQSNINGLFKDFNYSNGVLKFIKYDNSETRSITIEMSQGGGGETTPYTQGTGINISNHVVSLKPASTNEIGGIKVGGFSELSGKNYPVQINDNGVAYVNVPWTSGQVNASYSVDITPPVITVPTDTAGTGNVSNVKCSISVSYNGEPRSIDIDGIIVGTITRGSGKSASGIAATPVGNTAINVSFNNVSEFAGDSADIPINIKIGGSVIAAISISAIGMAAAPQSGANAITMWTSTETVHVGWEYNNCDPEVINFGVRSGDVVNTSFSNAGYTVWYSYGNQNSWTKLTSNPLTIDKTKLNLKYILVELRKGSSNTRVENTLVDSKYIHLIVDPAPAIGLTLYKINVLSTTIKHKNGTNYFGGTLSFLVTLDDAPILVPNDITLKVSVGGYNADAAVSYDNSTLTYSTGVTEHSLEYKANYPYTLITLKSGQNYVLDSVIVPFIMEGADGSSSQQVQSIQGTVMRVLNYNSAESVRERTTWYTGDTPDAIHNVRFMDILHYTLNNKDYGYFVKKGTSGSVNHAPVEIIDDVEKINYSVNYQDISGPYISSSSEWEQFQPMSEAVFNALLAKSAYIESLTVAKDLVITDRDNYPTAGMTGTDSTITTANGNTTNAGDIRIWAGYPTNNNLYNCPFYVTNEGILHAKQAIIEHGTLMEKITFERRAAYQIENGSYKPLQLARRLYEVTRGNTLISNNSGGSAYDVESLKLTTNHLIILSRGAYKSDPLLIAYAGNLHLELNLLLPPPHYVVGQSITITNESVGLLKTNDNDPTQIILKQENIRYIEDGQLETGYPKQSRDDASCILLTGAESGNPTLGLVTQEGTVQITTDGTNTEKLSGIWILLTVDSANGTYKQGTVVDEIVLDNYAWITVTAAEGYQKEDYSNMSDNIKKLNAMWVVTGYAYKE